MKKVDLHIHTQYSDGMLTLEEILQRATELRIQELAITDHDTIINLQRYKELSFKYGICIIPGIETATDIKGMHILGYGIQDFDRIETFMNHYRNLNKAGAEKTIELLKEDGVNISVEQVEKIMTATIISKRDITRFMVKMGYANNTYEVYRNFIGNGHRAYVPVYKIPIEELLEIISISGGIAVLAHPYTLKADTNFELLMPYLKNLGLKGIETHSNRHTREQKEFFSKIAKKYDLAEIAGSDFHYFDDGNDIGIEVEDDFLNNFHKLLGI